MAVGVAHVEIHAAVADKRMAECLAVHLDRIHVPDVKAKMDETGIAPEAVFIDFDHRGFNSLDQFQMRRAHQLGERSRKRLRPFQQYATDQPVTTRKRFQLVEDTHFVNAHLIISQQLAIEVDGAVHVADPQHAPHHTTGRESLRTDENIRILLNLQQIVPEIDHIEMLQACERNCRG